MDTETTQMGKGKRAGRAAARRAGLLAAEQLESSPVRSADEAGLPSFGEPSRRKAQVKVTYAGKKAQRTNAKRVRSLSPLTSVDSDSELEDGTTLPPRFRSPPLVPQSAPPKPRNNRVAQPIARSLPLFARKRAQTVPSLLKSSRSRSLSSLSSLSDTTVDHPGWGIEDHKLVFVRVDGHGNVSGSDEAMWWPAEVNNVDAPMRVTLFGEYPGSSAKARQRELVVERSSSVVLPFCSGPRKLRFDVRTYSTSSHVTDSLQASPRKRQKTSKAELDTRWCDARDLMLKKYQDMNDGLPLTLSLHVRNDSPDVSPQQSSARQPSISLSNDHDNVDHDIWEPDEIPYDIPGELVLAREKRTFTQYWPAKLMDYIPPQKRGEKAHYMVLFYDGKLKKLPDDSDMFYNESHPDFKSCLLGEDENNYGLNVGERDEDHDLNGHRMVPNEDLTIESLRSSSSEPQGPAPLAFASELSVQEQFEYVKPVLSAILTGQYEPARQKHIGFMKGGKQRNAVIEAAWKRGEVTSGEKEELSTCIVRWMRRRQNRQDMGFLPADPFVAIAPSVGPCDVVGETEIPVSNDNDDESDESVLTELTEHRSTMAGTERAPSSEVEIPLSSFVSTDDAEEDAQIYYGTDATSTGVNNGVPGRTDQTGNSASIAVADDLSRNTLPVDTLPLRPSTPTREQLTLPPSGTVPTFAHLSDLDQFTYCTSVLLPEAILQILLWRSGERKSYTLLPPSEEDRLHRIAERYASTTYWVHDIVKLKHLAEGKLLPSITPSYRADVESTPGNARLRPRRK